jgi:NADPH2:quinone reductase
MKAVICEAYGDHHGLVVKDLPAPQAPGPDEVQIDIKARGIAFSDLVRIAGDYQDSTEPPFVVGGEGAGTITAVGAAINTLKIGDKVLCSSGCIETINVPASGVTALPDEIDFESAAAYGSNYMTAYQGLKLANVQQGETLLVHGAAGGVGLAAVDLGKLFGARVIATASSDEKLKIVKDFGADETINYTDGFREQVKALTSGLGADVIYDPVGGDVFDESMRCIAPFGRILIVGFTSGRAALAKTNHLLVKNASVIGYSIGSLRQLKPTLYKQYDDTLMELLTSKRITPYVSHRFAMDDIVGAYQVLVDRKVIGKVIIT